MKTSDTQAQIFAAIFAAKREFPHIAKSKTGQAGNRTFNYAPLDAINDAIDPVLRRHDLMITHAVIGHSLITRLEHVSGEWREAEMPINVEHANLQSYGIELTYKRRYAVPLLLGIVTEEDKDIRAKEKRQGVDHSAETKPVIGDAGGVISAPAEAYKGLTPDWQQWVDQWAADVANACEQLGVSAAQELIDEAVKRDKLDPNVQAALFAKLDSKTRTALKKGKA